MGLFSPVAKISTVFAFGAVALGFSSVSWGIESSSERIYYSSGVDSRLNYGGVTYRGWVRTDAQGSVADMIQPMNEGVVDGLEAQNKTKILTCTVKGYSHRHGHFQIFELKGCN